MPSLLRIRCTTCNHVKPDMEFYNKDSKFGKFRECMSCLKKREQENRFKRLYGLTTKEYYQKLEDQGSVCANESCRYPLTGGANAHLDHCHKSGKVREFLCAWCNSAEGFLKSDPKVAEGLIKYMRKHNGEEEEC